MSGPISLDAVRAKHRRASSNIRRAVEHAASEASGDAVTYSREKHRYKNRTGALEKATTGRVIMLRRSARIVLKNARKYAEPIDMGARPHTIVPRHGSPLRFKVGGRWVSTWKVNHPGNQAYRFLYNATRHGFRMLKKRLIARLDGVARKF